METKFEDRNNNQTHNKLVNMHVCTVQFSQLT